MSHVDNGSCEHAETQPDSNGFVNRRSSVQSRASAPASKNKDFTAESAALAVRSYRVGIGSARHASNALSWLIRKGLVTP